MPGLTLLVVDDDPDVREFTSLVLALLGVRALVAGSCSEAVSLLRDHPAVSAVLLDVELPGRNGPETLESLRGVVPDLPVVYMTGDTAMLPRGHGALKVLPKPFGMTDLELLVRRMAAVARVMGPDGMTR